MRVRDKFHDLALIFIVNLIYSFVYLALCFDAKHWNGMDSDDGVSLWEKFFNRLYFSVVTFSTVGYGDITPATQTARMVVMTQILFNMTGMVRLVVAG